jgi:uncharacterized protein (DUF924 family)
MNADPSADVLQFWFDTTDPAAPVPPRMELWFGGSAELDATIRERFGLAHAAAARGELDALRETPAGRLAWVILLDQFSRQIHRGTAKAFASDAAALATALDGLERGWDRGYGFFQRAFFYLPLEHSEDLAIQRRSVALFTRLRDEAPPELAQIGETMLDFAQQHLALIERFGRFPHRNDELSRTTTVEEFAWMLSPGGGYGKAKP